MNIQKHMEVIFLVVLAVIGVGTYLFDQLPEAQAKPHFPIANNIGTATNMAVVVVRPPAGWRRGA